jgi:hypothetical protein
MSRKMLVLCVLLVNLFYANNSFAVQLVCTFPQYIDPIYMIPPAVITVDTDEVGWKITTANYSATADNGTTFIIYRMTGIIFAKIIRPAKITRTGKCEISDPSKRKF